MPPSLDTIFSLKSLLSLAAQNGALTCHCTSFTYENVRFCFAVSHTALRNKNIFVKKK